MVEDVDAVSRGDREWVALLVEFWRPLRMLLEVTVKIVSRVQG